MPTASTLRRIRSSALGLAGLAALVAAQPALAQTWTRLTHDAPSSVELILLLPDGTVMAAQNYDLDTTDAFSAWYRLTPDASGSYTNGTWTTLASMQDTRLYYASQVLRDGRVFVAGGEYGTGGRKAELYDPQANTWTDITPPAALWNPATDNFYDCNSELLPDGSVLLQPVFYHISGVGLRYNPATNTWSNSGQLVRGTYQDEASWVKLPDNSILTIDPFATHTERFIPATNSWVDDSIVPTTMYDPYGYELGAGTLLPSGEAFFLGSTGHTALYHPSGTTAPGQWRIGPNIPDNQGTPDAPAAMLPNGRLLCSVSPVPTSANHFPAPTRFFEYDWVSNSFAPVSAPNGDTDPIPCYGGAMLVLPDGNVLFSHFGPDLYVYHSAGAPLAAGKPVIASVSRNSDGSYHLTGTGLNGLCEGAWFGDDLQMNTNYPIIRLSDGGPNIYYARTYNWSNTGVMTGSQTVTTEFTLPPALPPSTYSVVVVANGNASDPACLNPPTITTNPAAAAACSGNAAAFSVTASGIGTLTYQWQLSLSPSGPWQSLANDPAPIPCGGFAFASPFNSAAVTIGVHGCPGPFMVRCLITNACGTTPSSPATLTINSADFNHDGDVGTDADIEAFFACLAGNCCATCGSADFNGDGDVGTDADIEAFFRVLAGGPC